MRSTKKAEARALLFERLVDRDPVRPYEPVPFRTVDRRALMESVRREVHRVLNTHCRNTEAFLFERDERSAYDYGVPDYFNFSPRSQTDRGRLERLLSKTISAYEPRLQRVRVEVVDMSRNEWGLQLMVEGRLVSGDFEETVAFPAKMYMTRSERGGSDGG